MTFAQVEYAAQRMQQQWHDLVMAEQVGEPREVLERMYDLYILMAEAYNACVEKYQLQRQNRRAGNNPGQAAGRETGFMKPSSVMRSGDHQRSPFFVALCEASSRLKGLKSDVVRATPGQHQISVPSRLALALHLRAC